MNQSSTVYFDSALIAKFYLNEPGRELVRELARTAGQVVSSTIAQVEVCSAFHRKLREGSIKESVFKALQGQFAHDVDSGLWTMVPVTDVLLKAAQDLFARLSPAIYLRALDALHLVTARSEKLNRLYTNDRHLAAACPQAGFSAVNPLA